MPPALELIDLPLSLGSMGLLLFCILGVAILAALARKELREDLRQRRALLDEAAGLLDDAKVTVGSDGYPRLSGLAADGSRISLEVVADSLVPRRLPQLWLKLTLLAPQATARPSIGVLARPVGTEFYSRVLGLPDTIAPSFASDFPLLMRGRGATEAAIEHTSDLFRTLFADPALKEIVITPRGAGTVRQIAEGDRGAHVLYRQMRFPVKQVSRELVRNALAELRLLNAALDPSPHCNGVP
jgi:hypothetical protein